MGTTYRKKLLRCSRISPYIPQAHTEKGPFAASRVRFRSGKPYTGRSRSIFAFWLAAIRTGSFFFIPQLAAKH